MNKKKMNIEKKSHDMFLHLSPVTMTPIFPSKRIKIFVLVLDTIWQFALINICNKFQFSVEITGVYILHNNTPPPPQLMNKFQRLTQIVSYKFELSDMLFLDPFQAPKC